MASKQKCRTSSSSRAAKRTDTAKQRPIWRWGETGNEGQERGGWVGTGLDGRRWGGSVG